MKWHDFVEALHRAIRLYVECEDYTDEQKKFFQDNLRMCELAMFIPTEFTPEQLIQLGLVRI